MRRKTRTGRTYYQRAVIALALSLSFALQPVDLPELRAQRITGQLGPAELRDNLVSAARLHAEAGDVEAAERDLAVALRVDPDLVLEEGLLLLAPLLKRARAVVEAGGGLRFSLSEKDGVLIIALDVDDLALVSGAEVEIGGVVEKRALDQETPTARVALGDSASASVYLVDEYGNVLAGDRQDRAALTKPAAPVAPVVEVRGPDRSSAMTTTGGVLALTGFVIFAGSAGTAATLAQDPEAGFLPPLLFGVGIVGAAAGTLGIGLMALDGES